MLPLLRTAIALCGCCLTMLSAAQVVVVGRVVDDTTGEPLPFVHVRAEVAGHGVLADADGRFRLSVAALPAQVVCRYVGYVDLRSEVIAVEPLLLRMRSVRKELSEAVVRPGLNPAHRVIEAVHANRKRNDGLTAGSFRYTSYARTVFTIEADSALMTDTARIARLDSNRRDIVEFMNEQHLLLIESATRRTFRPPNGDREEVLALRVSGFEDPGLLALVASTKTFSMYEPLIPLGEKTYMSPISRGSVNSYLFILEDTLYQDDDSVFVISYRPRTGKTFEGLAGTLWVNSDGYALQNVVAGPVKRGEGQGVKVQQVHKRFGSTWFPVQLNTTYFFDGILLNGYQPLGIGRVQLRDIATGIEVERSEVRGPELTVDRLALHRDEAYWRALRPDTLGRKELKTYHVIDSISKAENLGRTLKGLDALLSGNIPWGPVDIELRRIISANALEDVRLGLGLSTNDRVSRVARLGGWFGYGFGDQAWKYGGDLRVKPIPARSLEVQAYYANDLVESGGAGFKGPRTLLLSDDVRLLYMDRMDRVERIGASVHMRVARGLRLWIGTASELRINDLGYRFVQPLGEGVERLVNDFRSGEVSLDMRYAHGERLAQLPDRQVDLGTKWPVVQVAFAQAVEGLWQGEQRWWRVAAQTGKSFRTRRMGTPVVRVMAGMADATAAYPFLFNLRGSRGEGWWVNTPNAFETMVPGEFLADRFLVVHYRHSFGKLLLKTKKWQPLPTVVSSAGWGALEHPANHRGYDFRSMEQGFFESGAEVLFRNNLTALGFGAYWRYGPYALPDATDNLYLKLALGIGI